MARRSGKIHMVAAPSTVTVDRRPSNLAVAAGAAAPKSWFNVIRTAPGNAARVDIYEEIGGWGVTAADFAEALRAIDASEVHLHVNSPGGSVFDGLTIFNSIVAHPAAFHGFVDGLAASAASFIIQACDEITMNRGSMMMLHDAIAMTWGNKFDHLDSADLLGKVSTSIADVYASRAGGTAESWAAVMGEKNGQGRWYEAREAVDAGLADRVAGDAEREQQQDGEPVEQDADDDPREMFDRSSIAAGRRLVQVQRDDALAALATIPKAGPVCPICGGARHASCPSAKAEPSMAWLTDQVSTDPSPFAWLVNAK